MTMADETNTQPADNSVDVKQTVEVLSPDGKTMDRGTSAIASIFDKMEAAKNDGLDVKDVLSEVSKPKEPSRQQIPAKPKEEAVKEQPKQEFSDLDKKLGDMLDKKGEDEEISRGKLRQQAEPKKEEKKEDKKEEPAKETAKEDEVPEDELTVLPHDKPKTAKRIQALLKKIDAINSESVKTKAEVTEKANKLAELEKKLNEVKTVDPRTDEAIKKQLDELAMYRRRYDLEKDPEINTKFNTRIEQSENSIISSLKARNAGEGLLALIKSEGGWLNFSNSAKQITLADGTVATQAEISERILQALPLGERKAIEAAMVDQINTKRDKDSFFEKEQKTATEYFKNLEEQQKKQAEAQQGQVQEITKKIDGWLKETAEKNEWLKEKPIPEKATPEQKAAIESDNKYTRQLNSLLKKSLQTKDVDESLELVLDSVRYYQERREKTRLADENAKLKADLEKAQSEINKIRSASRSTPKVGSINSGGTSSVSTSSKKPASLEEAFNAIEQGQGVSDE